MNQLSAIQTVLVAAAISMVTLWLLQQYGLALQLCSLTHCENGSWFSVYTAGLVLHLIAGISGLLFMLYRKLPNATFIAIFAIFELFWAALGFNQLLFSPDGYIAWWIIKLFLAMLSFWLAYIFFNKLNISFLYKLLMMIVIMLITAFAGDRIAMLV